MKKRLISIFTVLAMLVAVMSPAAAAPGAVYGATFTDVGGHWAESHINTAVNKGFVKGYPDGTFLPDKAVTRAEFTTMVNKALGNTGTATLTFTDVPYAEWFYNDISKALSATYVAGYDNNTFKPNSPISRQEAAVMISRIVPTYGYSSNIKSYGDGSKVADWAAAAMQKVTGKGYMGAYDDGLLHPLDQLTRAQTAKIICDILSKETIITTAPVVKSSDTTLSKKIYSNGVTIHKDLGDRDATIDNCIILGNLAVQGGGSSTVTINNSRVASCNVNKSASAVRVLAKGEVYISSTTVSNTATLQTSNLAGGLYGTGFNTVNSSGSADLTLTGNFPTVNVNGTSGNIKLDSATVTTLNVNSAGRDSDITVESGSTISTANVNGVAAFHGTGTITRMNANVSNITYEEKPRTINTASGVSAPKQVDADLAIAVDPKNGATSVSIDKKITVTFNLPMTKYNGKSISNSEIPDLIQLRKDKSSGPVVDFTASINSAKKIITITPVKSLLDDTKYYIVIDKNTFEDSEGNGNASQSSYFTTGDDDEDGVTFYPRQGAVDVKSSIDPTITFDSAISIYGGGDVTSSYLEKNIILKENSSSGKDVDFEASINSSDKTITIEPDRSLPDGKYYLGFKTRIFKYTSGGDNIPEKSVTWTVGEGSELSSLSVSANTSNITASFTPSEKGTVYAIVVPTDDYYRAPTPDLIKSGKYYYSSSSTRSATKSGNRSVSANTSNSIGFSGSYAAGYRYTVFAYLSGSTNGDSEVVSRSFTISAPEATLKTLSVNPGALDPAFNSATKTYTVTLSTASNVVVAAGPTTSGDVVKIDGTETTSKTISVSGTKSITVTVTPKSSTQTATTYTINFRVVTPTAALTGLSVTPDGGSAISPSISGNMTVTVPYETSSVVNSATVNASAASGDTVTITYNGNPSFNTVTVTRFPATVSISVSGPGKTPGTYTLVIEQGKGDVSLSSVTVNGVTVSGSGSDYSTSASRKEATTTVEYEFKATKSGAVFSGDSQTGKGNLTFGSTDTSKTARVTVDYGGNRETYTLTVTMPAYVDPSTSPAAIGI